MIVVVVVVVVFLLPTQVVVKEVEVELVHKMRRS
jgi:hypothetical protein